MKILYWIVIVLLNVGATKCLWMGTAMGEYGKSFLMIPIGALLMMLPFIGMLIWTLIWKYHVGLLGLIIPCILVLWGFLVIIGK